MDAIILSSKGFNDKQISQMLKIKELGLDLSNINISTPVEKLRIIKDKLKNNEIPKNILDYVNILIKDGHDPVELLVDIKNQSNRYIRICYELLCKDYDIENLKKLDREKFCKIAEAILGGCRVSLKCLESPNLSLGIVNKGVEVACGGVEIEEYFNKGFSEERISQILCIKECNPKLDVSPLFDMSYDDKQIGVLGQALIHKIDLLSYCDNKFNYKQMWQIYNGLCDDVDVTIYNKRRYSANQMEIIEEALLYNKHLLENNVETIDITKILNPNYQSALMDLIFMCEKDKVDTSLIENKGYDFGQAFTILDGKYYGLDTSLYADPSNSAEEMRTIFNALILKNENKYDIDMSFILDKSVSVKSKIKYLADLIGSSYKNIDFSKSEKDTLDNIINDKSANIDNYYLNLKNNKKDKIFLYNNTLFSGITTDGCEIKLKYADLYLPDLIMKRTDMSNINLELVLTYCDELKKLINIISFVGYDDENGYYIKNLATGKCTEYIAKSDIGDFLYHFRRLYERIVDNTIEATAYKREMCFTVFNNLETMAQSFGPDVEKIMLSYDMKMPKTKAYIFEKDLHEKYGNLSKKEFSEILMKEVEMQYASYIDDTYEAFLYDKDGNLSYVTCIYGSRNIKEKLEEQFNVEFKEYTEFNIMNEETIER